MKPTQIHTTCLAALLLAAGCESGGGDDETSSGTTGASTTAPTTSDPSGGSNADDGGSGPASTSGATSGSEGGGSSEGGSDDTGTSGSTGFGSTGFGTTGGVVVDCQDLAGRIPVARDLTVNAAFGGALPDLDVDPDVLVVDFGDAASPSCLGVGAPACAPEDELVPWDMFELQIPPAALGIGNYAIGPSELILGQLVETAAQEPTCNSVTTREEFFAAFTIYGVSTSLDKELTGLDAYFCDYDGEVWRLDINVCG